MIFRLILLIKGILAGYIAIGQYKLNDCELYQMGLDSAFRRPYSPEKIELRLEKQTLPLDISWYKLIHGELYNATMTERQIENGIVVCHTYLPCSPSNYVTSFQNDSMKMRVNNLKKPFVQLSNIFYTESFTHAYYYAYVRDLYNSPGYLIWACTRARDKWEIERMEFISSK
jgi:hypothetical protein